MGRGAVRGGQGVVREWAGSGAGEGRGGEGTEGREGERRQEKDCVGYDWMRQGKIRLGWDQKGSGCIGEVRSDYSHLAPNWSNAGADTTKIWITDERAFHEQLQRSGEVGKGRVLWGTFKGRHTIDECHSSDTV